MMSLCGRNNILMPHMWAAAAANMWQQVQQMSTWMPACMPAQMPCANTNHWANFLCGSVIPQQGDLPEEGVTSLYGGLVKRYTPEAAKNITLNPGEKMFVRGLNPTEVKEAWTK